MLVTLADKGKKDEIAIMFDDRNKIQNKPEDLAQSYKMNINHGKYEVLYLGLTISISLNSRCGNYQFLVYEFHEVIDSVLFIFKSPLLTTQHSACPITAQDRAWVGSGEPGEMRYEATLHRGKAGHTRGAPAVVRLHAGAF